MSGSDPRIAWITGGGSGIGRGLALRFAQEGCVVAISGRTRATLEEAAGAAPAGRVCPYPVDVTDATALAAVAERIAGERGPVELAIASAGTFGPFRIENFSARRLANYFNSTCSG